MFLFRRYVRSFIKVHSAIVLFREIKVRQDHRSSLNTAMRVIEQLAVFQPLTQRSGRVPSGLGWRPSPQSCKRLVRCNNYLVVSCILVGYLSVCCCCSVCFGGLPMESATNPKIQHSDACVRYVRTTTAFCLAPSVAADMYLTPYFTCKIIALLVDLSKRPWVFSALEQRPSGL